MSLSIRRVVTHADKKRFIRLLWDIYGSDPNWVPPLMMDRLKLIDEAKNPFYTHAASAFWLAEQTDGSGRPRVVGRIAAIVNQNHNREHNEQSGFFGFFESIDDNAVSSALLRTAEDHLRGLGMRQILGPANPSSNDEYGLLVDGFDRPPVVLMPYNPPYYSRLIEGAGYTKAKDLYAYLLSQQTSRSEKLMRVAALVRERSNVAVRSFDPKRFDEEVELIKLLYNKAWQKNWGFVPFTDAEIDWMAKDLKQVYDPALVLFAERTTATGREPVGFALSLPDINQAFHAGRRIPSGIFNLPVGVINLLTKKRAIDTVRIVVLGVVPELRGRGIDALLYSETMERAKARGYEFGEASWVLEDNVAMNRAAEMMNGKRYKTYRIYSKRLT